MTEIYLIRHTQAEGNLYRMMQGHWDGGVTALGWKEIDALAERFREIPMDAVYASDLSRARLTASALTRYTGQTVIPRPGLREVDLGTWEAQFFANLAHAYPRDMENFIQRPDKWKVEGAETYADVQKRAMAELYALAEAHPGQRIAAVSHGVTIRCIIAAVTGVALEDIGSLAIYRNTSVSRLTYENGLFTAHELDDVSHLDHLNLTHWRKGTDIRDEILDPEKDRDFYCTCYAKSWLAAHGSLEGFDPIPYLSRAITHHKTNENAVLKLFLGDEPVGLLDMDTARGAEEGAGWISLIYVKEEYRRQGFGMQTLARALRLYSSLGRDRLMLHVADENAAALEFYRSCGFEFVRSEHNSLGELLTMERSLGGRRYV